MTLDEELRGYLKDYVEEDRGALSVAEIKRRLSPGTKRGLYSMYKRNMLPRLVVEYYKLDQWEWGIVDGDGVRSVGAEEQPRPS